jgi:hypothetical protein
MMFTVCPRQTLPGYVLEMLPILVLQGGGRLAEQVYHTLHQALSTALSRTCPEIGCGGRGLWQAASAPYYIAAGAWVRLGSP